MSTGGFQPRSMPGLFSATMPADTARALEIIMADSRPLATRAMAHALAECNLNDMLSGITVPTLLLYGDADERSGPEVAKAHNTRIPTSSLSILPGMGHMGTFEIARAIRRRDSRVPASRPVRRQRRPHTRLHRLSGSGSRREEDLA